MESVSKMLAICSLNRPNIMLLFTGSKQRRTLHVKNVYLKEYVPFKITCFAKLTLYQDIYKISGGLCVQLDDSVLVRIIS